MLHLNPLLLFVALIIFSGSPFSELSNITPIASNAVRQLEQLEKVTKDPAIKKQIMDLLPQWRTTENRIHNKLELAELELSQMQDKDVSLVQSSSKPNHQIIENSLKIISRDFENW